MPTKKTKKKNPAKKKSAPKKKIEKDIEEAVKKIPEFLFTKVEAPEPAPAEITAAIKTEPKIALLPPSLPLIDYRQYQTRRMILWATVLFFSTIIFGLWIWNMTTLWREAQLKKTPEKNWWQEVKTEIKQLPTPTAELSATLEKNKIPAELKTQLEKELAKAKIKNILGQNIASYLATTTKTP